MSSITGTTAAPGVGTAAAMTTGTVRRSLSVVIPVFNEQRGVEALVARLTSALDALGHPWDVLFVNDGSTDDTMLALRRLNANDPRIKTISLSRNFGKEIAVAAGLQHATGDGVVIMDGDLQHPPEVIGDFVARWQDGFDIVYGQRRDRQTDSAMQRASSRIFYRVFRIMSGTELPDGAGDFRLLDRKAVDAMNRFGERSRFNKGLFAWIGFKSVGVVFDVAPRNDGVSRWRPRRLLRFALDGIASFTTIPLRVWSYLGLLVSAFAFFYAMVFILKTLIWGADIPGFPTLIISVMLLGGVQLISLGVIGEYLGRVYEEVKGRPLYIVGERIGIDAGPAAGPQGAPDQPSVQRP
jgi:polyisoprenyl-phosphate glycosyltransferase